MTAKFGVRTRILHWLTALLIFAALLIGFAMVNSVSSYAALLSVHMTIGIAVLVVVILRIVNRRFSTLPAWPATVGKFEGKMIHYTELAMYGMMLLQPLIGWAMVSAAGRPPVIFGAVLLPRITPFNAELYFILRQAHSVGAYSLVIVIAAHVSMVLIHTVTLRDHMLARMTLVRRPRTEMGFGPEVSPRQ